MVSIETIAAPEATKQETVTVTNPFGEKFRVKVVFFPNRVSKAMQGKRFETSKNGHGTIARTDSLIDALADSAELPETEDDEEEQDSPMERVRRQNEESLMNAAISFCENYDSWDLTGPLKNGRDEVIVRAGEVIPMEPEVIRWVPPWLRAEVNQGIQEILFPSLRELRPSRKRS